MFLDDNDNGYTSRKWWALVGSLALVSAGYLLIEVMDKIGPYFGTFCLTVSGLYAAYAGINVASKLTTAVGNSKLVTAGVKPEGSAKPPPDEG